MIVILVFTLFTYFATVNTTFIELFPYEDPKQCNASEYFSTDLMKCQQCDSSKLLVPSSRKNECVCNERSLTILDASKFPNFKCEKCSKPNSIFSPKLNACIKCTNGIIKRNNVTQCKPCKENEIIVYQYTNGTFLGQTRCVQCTNGMVPSEDSNKCIPCPILNPIKVNTTIKCFCKYNNVRIGNLCVPSKLFPEFHNLKKNKYFLQHPNGAKYESVLFDNHLKSSIFLCKLNNSTACQMLANLCTLTLFSSYENSPCNIWMESIYSLNPESATRLPWLIYREGDANVVLNRKKITAQYSLNPLLTTGRLNLTAAILNLDGTLKEIKMLLGSDLNLCPDLNYVKDEALRFGVNYYYDCNVEARQLFSHRRTEFFVPYLQYWENGKSMLYAIPVLIKNLAQNKNYDGDPSNWFLVRRFFMFDTMSCIGPKINAPTIFRFIKSVQIVIKLRSEGNGLIYPPLIILDYDEISHEQFTSNTKISLHFSTKYEMKSNLLHSMEIAVGVLSALAVVYSGIQTWSHTKRSGKITVDLLTLVRILVFSCGNLANAFYLVAFGASVHTFIFYKGQSVVHLLLPIKHEENVVRDYIIVAFSLKIVEIIMLIWAQISIDIFLIDWERPRPQDTLPRPKKSASPFTLSATNLQQSVSIWRSYFVANEWNELQTVRKINVLVHMCIITFLLKVVGIEFWGTADAELHTSIPEHLKKNQFSFICRFAVGSLMYLIVYLLQLLFMVGLYERYIKNSVQQFVDVCSLTNISVFIMSLERYGYYIHGRSSHGFADTDMATMLKQLKREEEDLCAYRGLLPGTHQQTFTLGIPAKLRLYYNKLMVVPSKINVAAKITSSSTPVDCSSPSTDSDKVDTFDKTVQAYHNVNKFLSAFLEHALKDLDYDVKDKLFIESLLDIEFTDCTDRGMLYIDNGHSFDQVLFYGNEFTLFSFDIILFSFVLILSDDFIVTVLVTFSVLQILTLIRNYGGKKNIAKKTLIDERFLI